MSNERNTEMTLLALEQRVLTLEQCDQKNQNAHREFYNRLQVVEVSYAVAQERHEQIMKRFDVINGKLEELTSHSGKRWNGLVDKALYGVVGVMIAYIMTQIGF